MSSSDASEPDPDHQLAALDEIRREFVGMLAHDLRAPMTVIGHMAALLQDDWQVLTEEEKLDYVRRIQRKARNLAGFVDELLDVTKVDTGDILLRSETVDILQVIEGVLTEFRTVWPHRIFTLHTPESVSPVMADKRRQWQILSNLLTNACKYSRKDSPVQITVQQVNEMVEVSVRDEGVGISPSDQPRVFEKFRQFANAVDRNVASGAGLGLYICRSLVEAQGGTISIASVLGKGSTFTYTIPISEAA